MDNTKNLRIVFTGDTSSVVAAFNAVQEKTVETQAKTATLSQSIEEIGTKFKTMGSNLSSLGSSMTMGITLPMLGIGAVSGKLAYDFNNQMELLRTSAGIPQDAIAGLSQQLLDMSGQVGQAPAALAEGLYHVASAGNGIWNTAQMVDILKIAAQGANLGMANLNDTTYALSSTMASGIKGAENAKEAMASLTAIVGAGDMKLQDLNGALSTGILSAAKIAGTSLDSIGSALATLTDNGEPASEAASRLTMGMTLMANPTAKAAKVLKAIGLQGPEVVAASQAMTDALAKAHVTTSKFAEDLQQPDGLMVAMVDLKQHLEAAGLSSEAAAAVMSNAFGGGRTDKALMTLFTNIDRTNDKFQAIIQSAGQFDSKVADLNQTPMQRIRDAFSHMQADLIRLGDNLLPTVAQGVTTLVNKIDELGQWWESLNTHQQHMLESLGMIMAVSGPLLSTLGKMSTGLGAILKVVGGVGGSGLLGGLGKLAVALGADSSAVSALGLALGPIGIALAGVGITIGLVSFFLAGQKTATERLSDAQKQLKIDTDSLKQAQDSLKGAQLDLTGAQLGLKQAQLDYNTAVAEYGPNSLQAQQAAYQIQVAQQNVQTAQDNVTKSLQDQEKELQAVANDNSLINSLKTEAAKAQDLSDNIGHANAQIELLNGKTVTVKMSTNAVGQKVTDFVSTFGGPKHATGTNFAPGGWSLVGENGPELVNLARGSQVANNRETEKTINNHKSVNIGTIVLGSADAVREMFNQIDRDNLLVMKGLSPARGMR